MEGATTTEQLLDIESALITFTKKVAGSAHLTNIKSSAILSDVLKQNSTDDFALFIYTKFICCAEPIASRTFEASSMDDNLYPTKPT